jgi:tetratricopeptide (TPR) repeat protein
MKAVLSAAAVIVLAGSVPRQTSAGQAGAGQGQIQRFPEMDRPLFLSGRVVLEDGTPPPEQVLVQRACNGIAIPQGYTDAGGQFSFELGRNPSASLDAQNQIFEAATSRLDLTGCELRVQLPGFYPAARDLSGRRALDSPDVGALLLRRLPGVQGSIFSPTTLQARKDARAAFEKGRGLGREKKLDEALKEYEKAIRIAPGFAAAWFELGLVHQMLNHVADARKAYGEALLADPRFIKPYRQMAFLSFNEQKWEEVAETTDRWIGLDSVSYPEAYFFSAFANLYLNRLDAAERSAREAVKLDSAGSISRARYVLGAVLIEKKDYASAAEELRAYVEIAEPGPDVERAKQMLAQLTAKLGTRPVP